MLKFGTHTNALPLAIKNVLFRLDALYMFLDKKKLNRTLAIDSHFQTFTVGLLIEFID